MRHVEERKDSSFWLKTLRIWFKQLEGLVEMKQVWNREKGRISAWDVVGINHFFLKNLSSAKDTSEYKNSIIQNIRL